MAKKERLNFSFMGGGVCSVAGLGVYAAVHKRMREKYEKISFSGASIGAVIAVLLAAGLAPFQIEYFLSENAERFSTWLLGQRRIEKSVNDRLGNMLFRDLPNECIVSITPIDTLLLNKELEHVGKKTDDCLKKAIITRENAGDLTVGKVVSLSSSLPGMFLPGTAKLDGKRIWCLDGGMLFNPPLNPQGDNFLLSFQRNETPKAAKWFWQKRQNQIEFYADYTVKTKLDGFKTCGGCMEVVAAFEIGLETGQRFLKEHRLF